MPNDKLDINSLTLDDVLGEGVDTFEDTENIFEEEIDPQDVEDVEEDGLEDPEEYDEEYDEEDEEYEDEEEYDEENLTIASKIAQTLGFEIDEDFDDTEEGLTEFVREISQKTAEEQLNNLFAQFPEVQEHLDYVLAGGDSRKFFETQSSNVDFSKLNVTEDNVNMQRAIVAQYLQNKGMDNDEIQDTLDSFEDSGRLFSNAEKAKNNLASMQKQEQQRLIEMQKEQYQQQQQELQHFWNEVADTIETGNEFAGVSIPDREKARFFDYISNPVGPNGETQRDLDYKDAETEVKLAIDYMMYSGFDLEGIIDKKARTKSVRSLRDKIVSNEERIKNSRQSNRKSRSFNVDDLDLNNLIE